MSARGAPRLLSQLSEKALIRRGLRNPDVRAFVKVMGALDTLPSDRARRRVLTYMVDRLYEENPA